ncbi:MAG: hypothetical protein ACFCUU_18610 [Cyclobacteriaceae bacterium]
MKLGSIRVALLLVFIICLNGCARKQRFVDFESDAWIEDRNGCEGVRENMKDDLLKVKFRLRGKSTSDIIDILGRPDAQELYQRNQKYYMYYIQPGPECPQKSEKPMTLFIRFSAVGVANEISIKKE